ncbi:MAG: glycosyltransferase [Candidatus Lernaella stagnicola]|nr:glycosyltransferase [Candidatus Lernaella stagnicola]
MKYEIGIPLRDNAATVAHVVRAALAQKPPPQQVWVCDDGSLDDGPERARRAGATLVRHDHPRGLGAARNTLLGVCDADIVVFFDADAIPRPGTAAALLAPFTDNDVAAVGGRGVEAAHATFADRWRAAHTPQSHGLEPLDDDWMVMGLCVAFRVAALREAGNFDADFTSCGEDVEMSLRLRARGGRLAYRPDAIVDHARSDDCRGVLRQAWRHNRAAARALLLHGQATGALTLVACRNLWPACGRALRHLDLPRAAFALVNLLVRVTALRWPLWRSYSERAQHLRDGRKT